MISLGDKDNINEESPYDDDEHANDSMHFDTTTDFTRSEFGLIVARSSMQTTQHDCCLRPTFPSLVA